MAKYKITTDGGTYVVTTDDAPSRSATTDAEKPSIKDTISSMARPALEIGGAVVGGSIGLGAGVGVASPLTASAGGALGYATGKSAADALDEYLGLKESPQDLTAASKRIPENILTGAKMEALGMALHPVVKGVASTLVKGGKKIAGHLFDVSDEALEAYLQNPAAIKDAAIGRLAQKLPKIAEKFGQVIKHFSNSADDMLSTSRYIQASKTDPGGAITREEIKSALKTVRRKVGGVYGAEAHAAVKTIEDVSKDLVKLGPTASQKQVRGIVEKLDDNINWSKFWKKPEELTASENALIRLRGKLDSLIKTKNVSYAEAMRPVDEAMTARGEFLKTFNIDKVKGKGYVPADITVTRLNSALKEGRLATQRISEQTKKITGEDILGEVQKAKYNEEFFGQRTTDMSRPNIFALLGLAGGGGAAGWGGASAGSVAGQMAGVGVKKYGGIAGSKILDLLSNIDTSRIPIDVLKDPLLRRVLATRGVGLTGRSDLQIQGLLDTLIKDPFFKMVGIHDGVTDAVSRDTHGFTQSFVESVNEMLPGMGMAYGYDEGTGQIMRDYEPLRRKTEENPLAMIRDYTIGAGGGTGSGGTIKGVKNLAKLAKTNPEFRYHQTDSVSLAKIMNQGLKPAEGMSGKGIYFSPEIGHASMGTSRGDGVIFRIDRTKLKDFDYNEFTDVFSKKPDEGFASRRIPPEYLEFSTDNGQHWLKLKNTKDK
jgi:hypothetical protein